MRRRIKTHTSSEYFCQTSKKQQVPATTAATGSYALVELLSATGESGHKLQLRTRTIQNTLRWQMIITGVLNNALHSDRAPNTETRCLDRSRVNPSSSRPAVINGDTISNSQGKLKLLCSGM
jgi:hypothetical protein